MSSGQQAAIAAAKTDIAPTLPRRRPPKPTSSTPRPISSRSGWTGTARRHSIRPAFSPSRTTTPRRPLYETDVASVKQAVAALNQAKAQTNSLRGHLRMQQAALRANQNALDLTMAVAPFDAIVTNLPVREGETVVEGIQKATKAQPS